MTKTKTSKHKKKGLKAVASKMSPKNVKKSLTSDNIVRGATAVSLAAGVVAAGVALANKETRDKLGTVAGKGVKAFQKTAVSLMEEGEDRYHAVAHNLPSGKSKTRKSTKK